MLMAALLMTVTLLQAQNDKLVYRADKFFQIRNYDEAIKNYTEAWENGNKSAYVAYKIGMCHLQYPNVDDQLKSIPFLEAALAQKNEEIPNLIYESLGDIYHKDLQIGKALEMLIKFKETLKDPGKEKEVERKIEICNNAAIQINNYQSNIIINNIGPSINSASTEYNPVVTADESMMAFTTLRKDQKNSAHNSVEEIYITHRNGNSKSWDQPQRIDIRTQNNVGTAGLSHDGQRMLIFIGSGNQSGNLYFIEREKDGWSMPVTVGDRINSQYLESTASITPDGKTIFFASNRPGGMGGMDLYKIEKESANQWGFPKNLGKAVNSSADEDAPFIHPDQKTLFFTSDGHNTMGGKDIFKSVLQNGRWTDPENMGFPINTPANDNYFTLTADGSKGYFSSDRKGGYGGQDIYSFSMPEDKANVPLTLLKGRIIEAETQKPIPTQIKVIDNETSKKVDYVYNPDKFTGNYLIIFPPGKNYDLIIESEGYLAYTLNINIPNQTYYYELYQEIILRPIKHFDVIVGQEVAVKNLFQDTNDGKGENTVRKTNEAMLVQNDSLDLYDMMDAVISASDTTAYNYLLDLMFTKSPVENVDFDSYNNEQMEIANRSFYYDETDTTALVARKVGNEVIYTLPTINVTEEAKKKIAAGEEKKISYDPKLLEPVFRVYFDANESKLGEEYHSELSQIMASLKNHQELGIEISGYASADGDEEYNRKLSNQRAIEVLNYFNYKGIVRRRIIAKGYGATKTSNEKEESRRVEIRLVDLEKAHQPIL